MPAWLRREREQWAPSAAVFRSNAGLAVKTALIGIFLCHALFLINGYTSPDGTNEGLAYTGKNIFTVQYHPEACPGPQDSSYLFDRFLKMMEVRA